MIPFHDLATVARKTFRSEWRRREREREGKPTQLLELNQVPSILDLADLFLPFQWPGIQDHKKKGRPNTTKIAFIRP